MVEARRARSDTMAPGVGTAPACREVSFEGNIARAIDRSVGRRPPKALRTVEVKVHWHLHLAHIVEVVGEGMDVRRVDIVLVSG